MFVFETESNIEPANLSEAGQHVHWKLQFIMCMILVKLSESLESSHLSQRPSYQKRHFIFDLLIPSKWGSLPVHRKTLLQRSKEEIERHTVQDLGTESVVAKGTKHNIPRNEAFR